jgi:hypothetical protein
MLKSEHTGCLHCQMCQYIIVSINSNSYYFVRGVSVYLASPLTAQTFKWVREFGLINGLTHVEVQIYPHLFIVLVPRLNRFVVIVIVIAIAITIT